MPQLLRCASLLAVLPLLLAGQAPAPGVPPGRTVRFLAFGDAGSGNANQIAVGRAMARICQLRGCDFAIELGDNFYPEGVTGVDDPQFNTKFETPYKDLHIPIYVTLGNHDNGGGGNGGQDERGDFEVAYSSRAGRPSDKWHMPARYYTFSAAGGSNPAAPLADFFCLDSTIMADPRLSPEPRWNREKYGAEQLAWFKSSVAASHARWKIAFAHYPYISNGYWGNAGTYLDNKNPALAGKAWQHFFEQTVCDAGFDLMFQGHEHSMESLPPVERCGRTQFITSGAGGASASRPFNTERNVAYWSSWHIFGFFWIELREDSMTASAYQVDIPKPGEQQEDPLLVFEQNVDRRP